MATPIMMPVSVNFNLIPGNAGKIRIDTLDADGAPLNVSSGYTVDFVACVPQSDANPDKAATDIKTNMTPAFDATGVTLSWTAAQSAAIAAALYTLRNSIGIGLSNDSGSTASVAASGTMTIVRDKFLQT